MSIAVSCGGDEPIDPTPSTPENPSTPTKDTKAPVISVSQASVNVIGGLTVTLGTSELKIGDKTVATWTDNVTKTCKGALEFNGQTISSGSKLSEPGKLKLSVTDGAGNTATAGITLTNEDAQAPQISVAISEKNVIAGIKVNIQDNQLLFDDSVAATWTDDYSTACKAELSLLPEGSTTARAINPGDKLSEAGTLKLMIADDFNNIATASIKLTAIAIYGLENLQNLSLQVEKEVNLLQGLTFADGVGLIEAEIEIDGVRSEIPDPVHFSPQYPSVCRIILSLGTKDGPLVSVSSDNLTIRPMDYQEPALQMADFISERYEWF